MSKIITLALAILIDGMIDSDGSGLSESKDVNDMYLEPEEFAVQYCGLSKESYYRNAVNSIDCIEITETLIILHSQCYSLKKK